MKKNESIKILLVEPILMLSNNLKKTINDQDYLEVVGQCSESKDTKEFLSSKGEVDVIIMDLSNIVVTAREIKAEFPKIKIIGYTSKKSKGDIADFITLGRAYSHLSKFDTDETMLIIEIIKAYNSKSEKDNIQATLDEILK